VDKSNPEDIKLTLEKLSQAVKRTILARTGYYNKLEEEIKEDNQ
jgi:hypothetical protein